MSYAEDPKKLPDQPLLGAAGVGLVDSLVHQMGHNFHAYGQPEVGIDGAIELRDPETHAMTGRVLFVQSKAHEGPFDDETARTFTYTVDRRDLDYWMDVSGPVLLVVSRPSESEAYWLAVKEFFEAPARRESRLARFNKQSNALAAENSPALDAVFRRDEARRAEAAQSLVYGPLAVLGLEDELAAATSAYREGDWASAADGWVGLAASAEGRLQPAFIWPLLERAATALREGGRRQEAIETYKRLARGRLDEDDPSGDFDIQRAVIAGAEQDDFELALLWVRSRGPELGVDSLDELRDVRERATTATELREATAALADALLLYGGWKEAIEVTDAVRLKMLNSPLKRGLLMDRCDAAGELGMDVEDDWRRVLRASRRAGPWHYGRALQRRGAFLTRQGEAAGARRAYLRAADIWSKVPGAEDQAAEAMLSMQTAGELNGQPGDRMPFGTRAAAALARGQASVPAVRADRLALSGLAYLADRRFPDALKHLTLGLMVERRAGDLFGWRRALLFVARAYEAVDEPDQALRFWVRAGDERRAEEAARRISFADGRPMLRLDAGQAWERSASFAALSAWARALTPREVSQVARPTIAAAREMPGFVAPQPSFQARKVLAAIAPRLAKSHARGAARILREEIETDGYSAGDAAMGLIGLHQRGLVDAADFLLRQLILGRNLPVTVARHLREASRAVQTEVVDAALNGNAVVLGEAARADLPETYPELRNACDEHVRASLRVEKEDSGAEQIGVSFFELGDLGRHCPRKTQRALTVMLLDVVFSARYDSASKVSAMQALAVLAPALEVASARRALLKLTPIAAGEQPPGPPSLILDHRNPARARSVIDLSVEAVRLRGAALQAAARLARLANPRSRALAAAWDSALVGGEPELVAMALRELAGLPDLPITQDLRVFLRSEREEICDAARAAIQA